VREGRQEDSSHAAERMARPVAVRLVLPLRRAPLMTSSRHQQRADARLVITVMQGLHPTARIGPLRWPSSSIAGRITCIWIWQGVEPSAWGAHDSSGVSRTSMG
jgi:hypothetical protein